MICEHILRSLSKCAGICAARTGCTAYYRSNDLHCHLLEGENLQGADTGHKILLLYPYAPVHGNWSEGSAVTPCSMTCGEGTQGLLLTCTNPPPSYGGKVCSGSPVVVGACQDAPCPCKITKWRLISSGNRHFFRLGRVVAMGFLLQKLWRWC